MKTHQITVRKVDPVLKAKVAQAAKLKSQSINDWMLDALRAKTGLAGSGADQDKQKTYSWEKHMASMPQDAFNDDVLADFEKIDPKMWE